MEKIDKKKLSERDIWTKYITPTLIRSGWDHDHQIRKRSFDKQHFKDMVIEYLKKFGEADRRVIEKLLLDNVSDALTEEQKRSFIKSLLQEMRKDEIIKTKEGGSKTLGAKWVLSPPQ